MKNIFHLILTGFILVAMCSCRKEPRFSIRDFRLNIPDGDTIVVSPDGDCLQIYAISEDEKGERDYIYFIGYGNDNNFQQAQTYYWETDEISWAYKRVEKTAKLEIKPNHTGEQRKRLFQFTAGVGSGFSMFTIIQNSK